MIIDNCSYLREKIAPTTREQSITENSTLIEIPLSLSPSKSTLLSFRKTDHPMKAAQKFCFDNNLDFKLIQPISKRIDLLLQNDDLQNCSMRHINVNEQQLNLKKTQQFGKSGRCGSISKMLDSSTLNIGEMMYERNCRLREMTRRKNQKIQEQIQAKNNKQLTFQPEINQLSKIVVGQIEQSQGRQQFYSRKKQQRISKIFGLQKSKQKLQMKECTFKPMTNSRKFSSQKQLSKTYYLHNLSKPKKYQLFEKQQSSFSFHPKINQVSQMIVNGVPFQERQEKYQYDRIMRRSESIRQSTQSLRSSQCKINNKLTQTRNLQKLPIGEHLYNQRLNKQMTIQKIKQQMQSKPLTPNMKSSKIYQANKYKAFLQIFRSLDSNGDCIISASKIETKRLPPQILELIAPLLVQIQQMSVQLSEQQFMQALDKLYSTLNVNDKNTFLKLQRKYSKPQNEKYSFKPSLDQNSHVLATKVRQFSTPGVSLYNFCQQRRSLLDKKLQQKRREKQNIQVSGCTFRPLINK